jgi:hypothetical protein
MKKVVVYGIAAALEILWVCIWYSALAQFRRDPLVFFEILLLGGIFAGAIGWIAKALAEERAESGRLASRIEEWERLRAVMRQEELRRRHPRPR